MNGLEILTLAVSIAALLIAIVAAARPDIDQAVTRSLMEREAREIREWCKRHDTDEEEFRGRVAATFGRTTVGGMLPRRGYRW